MSVIKKVAVTTDGVTLPLLIWQVLKRQPRGFVSRVLEHNPGLAGAGAHLPVGTVVNLPIDEAAEQNPARDVTRLWD